MWIPETRGVRMRRADGEGNANKTNEDDLERHGEDERERETGALGPRLIPPHVRVQQHHGTS